MPLPPLPQNVFAIADSVRRALGIETPLQPDGDHTPPAGVFERAFEDRETRWFAANDSARVAVHTYGYYPDTGGYSGGQQAWTITLFGTEPEPRGEIVIEQFQWAGFSAPKCNVPQPILDALRADGIIS